MTKITKRFLVITFLFGITIFSGGWVEIHAKDESVGESSGRLEPTGVCPPFSLRDEEGQIIDPVNGINDAVPYSPRQTCGTTGCHDYTKITEGYHFTQGAGENPTANQKKRLAWATTPGNFGGSWCSPAPLYRYLSMKQNDSPATMDMTAYTFISSCGACHPGGGSAEFDRDGHRYDRWIQDPASGFSDGADNNFDGDYYKAKWNASGVLEADCLLCHLPDYDYKKRSKQIESLNYRWAATAGSQLADVSGSIAKSLEIAVQYDPSFFNEDGTVTLPLVRSPRNEACLSCHEQPGWKKRGANYRPRTDVHLRAGMRCVDCHPAGSSAEDSRISGREVHQFAKGDDPGGLVRNDLDDTMPSCSTCHETGRLGAPVARHKGLPPLHLDRIACQTCHIPERLVMPIQYQAGDVFSTAPKIPSPGKRLWSFYGPDDEWRNHYGFLEMMGYDDKPTERFKPSVGLYKDKIYPLNRIHSSWPGIEIDGQAALMQPRMSDIAKMWTSFRKDASKYPSLGVIVDNTGDGIIEVNRPEEIDALIEAVGQMLTDIAYPMENKRVVWVYDDRVYRSGSEFTTVEKDPWEASPFANTHKYSHDIYPAKSALGSGGCTDCHSRSSDFMFASTTLLPFGPNGEPVKTAQHHLMGITPLGARVGAWRESILKVYGPWLIGVLPVLCLFHLVIFGVQRMPASADESTVLRYRTIDRVGHALGTVTFLVLAGTGLMFLFGHVDSQSSTARNLHTVAGFIFALAVVVIFFLWVKDAILRYYDRFWIRHIGGYLGFPRRLPAGKLNAGQKLYFWFVAFAAAGLTLTGLMMVWGVNSSEWSALVYTAHDTLAILFILGVMVHFYLAVVVNPGLLQAIIEGKVKASWVRSHHPKWSIGKHSHDSKVE